MNVYIKGMEMPTGCGVCPFSDEECFGAWKCWRVKDLGNDDNRAKDCPLIPVPPHGRLIDADVLEKVMSEGIAPSEKDGGFKHPFDIIRAVANAPTIIPADEMI